MPQLIPGGLYVAGKGTRAIAIALNAEGLRTKTGAEWTDFAFNYVLANPVDTGKVAWGRIVQNGNRRAGRTHRTTADDMVVVDAVHEPIIDRHTWEAVQEIKGQPRTALGGFMSSEQLQGFVWGVGAAALLLMVLPSAKEALRPFAVATVKGAMEVVDRFRFMFGEAGEGLQDLIDGVQFERQKDGAAPGKAGTSGQGNP